MHLSEHFRTECLKYGQFFKVCKFPVGCIAARLIRRYHEYVIHVVHLDALTENLKIGGLGNALIADKNIGVVLGVHVQNMFKAPFIFIGILKAKKGKKSLRLEDSSGIFRILVSTLGIKTGQQETKDKQEKDASLFHRLSE